MTNGDGFRGLRGRGAFWSMRGIQLTRVEFLDVLDERSFPFVNQNSALDDKSSDI